MLFLFYSFVLSQITITKTHPPSSTLS